VSGPDCNARTARRAEGDHNGPMSHDHANLLGGPAPTLLPADHPDTAAREALAGGADLREAARRGPASSLVWALLAERALTGHDKHPADPVAAYAFARTGYHRGLDALRRAGWRGQGPIPLAHEPNQGFLRALLALADAADAIGEADEAQRCATFLADSGVSADGVRALR
jgi:Protein of unknown function (DUF3151)